MNTPKGFIDGRIMDLLIDEEMLRKIKNTNSVEERYDLVKDRVDLSFEDFKNQMEIAEACLAEMGEGELSEDDLEMVSGGKSNGAKVNWIKGKLGE